MVRRGARSESRQTRPGISRFRARCFASPRNDGIWLEFRSFSLYLSPALRRGRAFYCPPGPMTPPKKLHIKSYGCQMNVYDAQRMADTLAGEGFVETADVDDADLVIL